jgi:hypothetical protein
MRALLFIAVLASLSPQDAEIDRLLRKLGSSRFEEQKEAAKALQDLGPKVLPAVERARDDDDIQVRSWAEAIHAEIQRRESARIRSEILSLVEKAAADAKEDQRGTLEKIRSFGNEAIPGLRDAALNAKDMKVKRRAVMLLGDLRETDASGNRYATRWAARDPSSKSDEGVLAALSWLARHQGEDGGWCAENFPAKCGEKKCSAPGESDYDVGVTALALLAFLGAGHTHLSKSEVPNPVLPAKIHDFGDVVRKATRWLMARQDREGCVGERGVKYMYGHALATEALCEAFGMAPAETLKEAAQKAVDFLAAAQNPGKGWRYSAKCGDNDSSVTAWAVMALKSAELSRLRVPDRWYEGALAWYDEATDKNGYYRTGYVGRGSCRLLIPSRGEEFDDHPSMSGAAIVSRILMGTLKADPTLAARHMLLGDLPEWKSYKIDFYYWFIGSLALFQFDGPDGLLWKKWREPVMNAILSNQKSARDGCACGSWDAGDRWSSEGGRVYATALNALTLETEYRFRRFLER